MGVEKDLENLSVFDFVDENNIEEFIDEWIDYRESVLGSDDFYSLEEINDATKKIIVKGIKIMSNKLTVKDNKKFLEVLGMFLDARIEKMTPIKVEVDGMSFGYRGRDYSFRNNDHDLNKAVSFLNAIDVESFNIKEEDDLRNIRVGMTGLLADGRKFEVVGCNSAFIGYVLKTDDGKDIGITLHSLLGSVFVKRGKHEFKV